MELSVPFLIAVFGASLIAWILFVRLVISNLYALSIPTAPLAYPIIGHLWLFKNLQQMCWLLVQIFNGVDRIAKLRMFTTPVILVNHPDLLQKLMNQTELNNKPFLYSYIGLVKGLITEQCGQAWRFNRKLLSPAFNMKVLNEFIPTMDVIATKMVNRLESLVDEEAELDMYPQISQCALEIVFTTTVGCKTEEQKQEYIRRFKNVSARWVVRDLFNFDKYFNPIYSVLKKKSGNRMFCSQFTRKIVKERRMEMSEGTLYHSRFNSEDGLQIKEGNFLNHILRSRRSDGCRFSEREILNHINTIIVAGNETSALTAANACLNLAMEPEVQSKVVAEIKQVFHSPTVEISHETLKQLVYLEMVIKETLRLHPPVPIVARSTVAPIELDGIRIPKDQMFCFSFYNLHRRTDFWGDDVERFDPERFHPEAVKERHPYAFLPFSGGFRDCVGRRYAMNAVKIMIARILLNFEISTVLQRKDLRFRWTAQLQLAGPHAVRLKKRNLFHDS